MHNKQTINLYNSLDIIVMTVISLILFRLYFIFHVERRWLLKLRGPRPYPIIGNILDFIGPSEDYLGTLLRYKNEYGDILKIHDGLFSVSILITDQKLMEYILSSTKIIDKSYQYTFLHNWLGTGLLTSSGTKWKKRRRMLTPCFHFSILKSFIDIFDSVSDVFVEKLEKEVGKSSLDIYPLVSLCTLDIICEAAMGTPINAQEDQNSKYVKAVKAMCTIIVDRVTSPLDPRLYSLTINYYREKRILKMLHDHTDKVIDRKMADGVKKQTDKDDASVGIKKRQAFLDLLLTCTIDGQPMSRSDIREEVDTFMFEGHDTVSSVISFTLFALATHPRVMKKALEEQKEIFHDLKSAKVKTCDLQKMKYLDMIIKESLRLYPPVPLLGRSNREDFEWEGVTYPKGVNIILFSFATHRDPKYFPDPDEFIPERWDGIDRTNPFVYLPFSAGPRNCIGQKFAMLELKTIISKVVRNFDLHPSIPEHKLKLAPDAVLVSKNGVHISLEKRK